MPHDLVTFVPGALPAHLAANPPPISLNAAAQQGIRIPFPVVSIEGRRWSVTHRGQDTLIKASPGFDANQRPLPEVAVSSLNVIVVGIAAAISKAWYARAFQPGVKILMPDCFSTNGETPDPQSPMRQSDLCATCPKNQFESAMRDDGTPGRGKACRDGRKIAIVPAGDVQNKVFGGPMMLRLPVMSIPNLAKYCGQLNIHGVDIGQVVTRMSFNSDVTYPEIQFEALGYITDANDYSHALEWMRSDIVRTMLDESPSLENTGVSPIPPTREQFAPTLPVTKTFAQEAEDRLFEESNAELWIGIFEEYATTAASLGELQSLFALSCVVDARANAPATYRGRIQTMFDTAIDRLSPKDEPPPDGAKVTTDTPPSATTAPEMDSAGVIWDAAVHASTKAKKADGTWRARRGGEAPAAVEPTPPPASSAADFSAWLVDSDGREMPDEDGVVPAAPYDDPITFARAYRNAVDSAFPGAAEAIRAANEEAVADAMRISPDAARIIRGDPEPVVPELPMDMPRDAAVVPAPPAKPRPSDMVAYKSALQAKLDACATPAALEHVQAVNQPVYSQFAATHNLACATMVATRAKALAGTPAQTPEEFARNIQNDIEFCSTTAEIDAWKALPAAAAEMDRLKAMSAVLHTHVEKYAEGRRATLRGRELQAIADADPRTAEQVRDHLLARVKACSTQAAVRALPRNPAYLADVNNLLYKSPEVYAAFNMAGKEFMLGLPA